MIFLPLHTAICYLSNLYSKILYLHFCLASTIEKGPLLQNSPLPFLLIGVFVRLCTRLVKFVLANFTDIEIKCFEFFLCLFRSKKVGLLNPYDLIKHWRSILKDDYCLSPLGLFYSRQDLLGTYCLIRLLHYYTYYTITLID